MGDETTGASRSQPPDWSALARNALLVLVLLGMIWLAFNVRLPSIDELRAILDGFGGWAWICFIGLYALVAITPIPVTVMALAAGVMFGVIEGSILSVIGALIGSWIAYWLARALGRDAVTRLLGKHASTIEDQLEGDSGMRTVIMLRLTPGLPYWPVNYGSGAFGISQRDFLVGSGLSTVPGQLSLVAVGAFLADPALWRGIVVVSAWAVVIVMTVLAYRAWRRSRAASASAADEEAAEEDAADDGVEADAADAGRAEQA